MRHKKYNPKVKKSYIKYVLINKEDKTAEIHHYKTVLAEEIGVSVRTLDRNMPYENEKYTIYPIKRLNL